MLDLSKITVHIFKNLLLTEIFTTLVSVEWTLTKGNEAGTFKVVLNKSSNNIENIHYNDEIKIYYDNSLKFGGRIQTKDIDDDNDTITIGGYSYTFELLNKQVNWKYTNEYAHKIVESLVDLHNSDGEISYVSGLGVDTFSVFIDEVLFQQDMLSNAVQKMADVTNASYWVDANKKLYFKKDEYVSGDITNMYMKNVNVSNMRVTKDSSTIKNRGFLFGGAYSGQAVQVVETIQNSNSVDLFGPRDFCIYDTSVTTSGYAQYKLISEITKYSDPKVYGSFDVPGGDINLNYDSYINLKNFGNEIDDIYLTKSVGYKIDLKGATTSINFESRVPNIEKITKELDERISRLEKSQITANFIFNILDRFGLSDFNPGNQPENICLYDSGVFDNQVFCYEPYLFLYNSDTLEYWIN